MEWKLNIHALLETHVSFSQVPFSNTGLLFNNGRIIRYLIHKLQYSLTGPGTLILSIKVLCRLVNSYRLISICSYVLHINTWHF